MDNPMFKSCRLLVIIPLTLFTLSLHAEPYAHPAVKQMLQAPQVPDGVVIELLDWNANTWQWATPLITSIREQLKSRYPDIDVAVVSHGAEQFQLTKDQRAQQPLALNQLQQLDAEGVNVHVCGTHSYWQDVPQTAYLDFVDVSPSGPAQINDYIKLGYKHILLKRPL